MVRKVWAWSHSGMGGMGPITPWCGRYDACSHSDAGGMKLVTQWCGKYGAGHTVVQKVWGRTHCGARVWGWSHDGVGGMGPMGLYGAGNTVVREAPLCDTTDTLWEVWGLVTHCGVGVCGVGGMGPITLWFERYGACVHSGVRGMGLVMLW